MTFIRYYALTVLLACIGGSITTSCGNPSSVSTPAPPKQSIDLTFARALLDAQTVIEQAKALPTAGTTLKDPLNKIIAAYNEAYAGYQVFHAALVAGGNPDSSELAAQIAQLATASAQLRGMFQ